jgi:hypothetical protein
MENKKTFTLNLECVKLGYANGIAPGLSIYRERKMENGR